MCSRFKSRRYFRGLSFTAVLFVLQNQNFMLKVDEYRYFVILANNKKRSHTQLDSRKQVIAFQDRVITINIKEAQHPLK